MVQKAGARRRRHERTSAGDERALKATPHEEWVLLAHITLQHPVSLTCARCPSKLTVPTCSPPPFTVRAATPAPWTQLSCHRPPTPHHPPAPPIHTPQAISQLLEIEERRGGGAYGPDTLAVGIARLQVGAQGGPWGRGLGRVGRGFLRA